MSLRLLLTTDAVGGVWQYSLELAAALASHNVETVLAVLGPPPSADQRLALTELSNVTLIETGLPLDWLCDGPDPVRAAGGTIADLAAREGIDLVQLNMPTLAADARFTMPVVAVTHGCVATWWAAARGEPLAPAYNWHRAMMARGLAAADRVVAPSHAYAAIVAAAYDLPTEPHAVHNGRSLPTPAPLLPQQDAVLTVGRLWDSVKNARLLDQVAAGLAVPFHAAGAVTGPHGETITLTHLRALGEISGAALAARLAARPVFVSAASFEPFGLAVLEAAAAGCALVLSDIATFRELWDDAASFVAQGDVAGYRSAIERLVGDPMLRQSMGDAARVRAARYTPARTAAAMHAVYAELVPASAQQVAA
ncbi:glycosyltransferase family 4 protein [Sphingomonas endolithica]|uniref:glycosyltransferase family 4 protein n=1 Tax=Sphingomonas endolithica TaxID=2972485 RepID=UPI0021AF3D01|nr:glycosyltransferase family 4 protein [Sphingomonas sp. ZFBP2030]